MKMSVVLFRVDERLIHGQVAVGWGSQLHPDRIIVVDDELAASDWEQELYCLGLPADIAASFVGTEEARGRLDEWEQGAARIFVLVRDLPNMLLLARGGVLHGRSINIGGIHHAPGRREVLPYVFLSDADAAVLRELAAEGADVSARDLPGARRVDLAQLLEGTSRK
jgi:mannose/fructose/N-acetylgalactosamine-specific phosphotransferase system component IIB